MTDPGLTNLPENWGNGDTIDATDFNAMNDRTNYVEDLNADDDANLAALQTIVTALSSDNADDVEPADLAAAVATLTAAITGKQPIFYSGTVTTAAATAAKTVTLDAPYASYLPVVGDYLELTFVNGSAVSTPTLSVNGDGPRGMASGNGATSAANTPITAGVTLLMMLRADGTWQWIGSTLAAFATVTQAEVDAGTSTSQRVISGQIAASIRGPLLVARTVNGSEGAVITSGSITAINSLTVGGVTLAVGDKFVVLGAPVGGSGTVALGVGTTLAAANGLYQVVSIAGSVLTVARAAEMAGANSPVGKMIRVTESASYGPGVNTIVTVNNPVAGAFVWGTTALSIGDYYLGYLQTLARITTLMNRAYTTAARPTPASLGVGAQIYDTTLLKPVFSDGTNWRDAAGTIV